MINPRQTSVALLAATTVVLAAAPAASAASKRCGPGLHAGKNTSCKLAKALFKKTGRSDEKLADGQTVSVRSPVTGDSYAFRLYRADAKSFTAVAKGNGQLSVRIDY